MEAMDWNMEEEESNMYVDNQQELSGLADNDSRNHWSEVNAQNTQDNQVQSCSNMVTMETIRPEKNKYYSLQIFKFGSLSASSSSSSLNDSVPLLDDEDSMWTLSLHSES